MADVSSQLVRKVARVRELLGSWTKSADALARANDYDASKKIDRRALEKLGDPERYASVRLTIDQLVALDRFFGVMNEGALLAHDESLIDALVESPEVNFVVGARFIHEFNDDAVARWDLRAIMSLQRTPINRSLVKILDVTNAEHWSSREPLIKNCANIFIASPIASHGSDFALNTMVGTQVGVPCEIGRLPFAIIGAERDAGKESNFIRSREEAASIDPSIERRLAPNQRGLLIGKTIYASTEQINYALLVAQRDRTTGRVQICLCGLSGPGTHYLAKMLQLGTPHGSLPMPEPGEKHPRILVAAYELAMEAESSEQGRGRATRRVGSAKAVYGPELIRCVNDKWMFPDRNDRDRITARRRWPGLRIEAGTAAELPSTRLEEN